MRALFDWIAQLGFLVFFAGAVQILLPDNDLRKAARLVIGLVLIVAVIEPAVAWLDGAAFLDDSAAASAGWLSSGEAHIRRGQELAEEAMALAQAEWLARAERELAALAALVPGVEEAEVSLWMGDGGVEAVDVRLRPAEGSGDPGAQRVAEERVRRLVEAFWPSVDWGRVSVVWPGESTEGR